MAESEKSSSNNTSKWPSDYTGRGELVEDAERRHVASPLTREEFLAFLLKTGKVPPRHQAEPRILSFSQPLLKPFAEPDLVQLQPTHPECGLPAGALGAAVLVHAQGEAYEVKFVQTDGHTRARLTLPATEVSEPPQQAA